MEALDGPVVINADVVSYSILLFCYFQSMNVLSDGSRVVFVAGILSDLLRRSTIAGNLLSTFLCI